MSPAVWKAKAAYDAQAARCDSAWQAYRAARARQARKPGTFAAEQAVIDAGERVAATLARLDDKAERLRSELYHDVRLEMFAVARARCAPFPGPNEIRAELMVAMRAITNGDYQ